MLTPREEFDRLAPEVARALEYEGGLHTVDDIWAGVEKGEFQFWPGERSMLVTQILTFPRQKDLLFFLAAGDLTEIQRLYPIVLEWAKQQGCSRALMAGRKGWERTFLTKEEGWRSTHVVMEKEL